jgi:hypothetical protein
VITGNAKTVTSVDRQNALVGHFDIHNFSIIFYIPSVSIYRQILLIFYFLSFLTTKTISPFRTSHSQSILSPSFSFHCFIMLIGITVRNDAKLDDAFDTVVISPTGVIYEWMSISLLFITLSIAISITIIYISLSGIW